LELRDLAKRLLEGKCDIEIAKTVLCVYSQTAKRENMLMQIAIASEKQGNKDKTWKRLNSMNLINEKTAIDVGETADRFKCPLKGEHIIGREECMDLSGASHNIDFCQNCEQFSITRKCHD